MKIGLTLDRAAMAVRKSRLNKAQDYIDSECLKQMDPLVPVARWHYRNSGRLKRSGKVQKRGLIVYTAPLARYGYYAKVNHKNGGNPKGQRLWFKVMKANCKTKILKKAARIAGGKPE